MSCRVEVVTTKSASVSECVRLREIIINLDHFVSKTMVGSQIILAHSLEPDYTPPHRPLEP
jgi:hypothetical protein